MTRSLFRSEALEFQKHHREFGKVGRLQGPSHKVFAWLLVVAVSAIAIFICVAGYTRKETVAGYLVPATGTAEIFVPQQGTVTKVHVSEGQSVDQGDILLTVDTSQITADGVDLNSALLKSLSVQKTVLLRQIEAEGNSTKSEQDRLTAAIRNGEAELVQLTSQIGFQEEQIVIAQKLVDTAQQMQARGYISAPEVYRREESLLIAKQTLSSLKQRYSARETELTQTRSSLQQMPTDSARRLQPLRSELAQLEQRMAEIGGRRSFVVRAPIAGRVTNLQAAVGKIADPRRLQLDILPLASPLQAVLFVPTRAIGFIRPGQRVRLLYDAFPFQRFGTYSGRVVSVSQTILSDAGLSAPFELKEPAYKVVSALDRPDVDANGQKVRSRRACFSEPTSCSRSASWFVGFSIPF
jgi:membrane fusion protein